MFLGTSRCKLTSKGRMNIYYKFRGNINESLIISRIYDDHLTLMLESDFSDIIKRIEAEGKPRKDTEDILRFVCGRSEVVTMDAQGRILIPKIFIEHAQLSQNVVQVGRENKIELWDEAKWLEHQGAQTGIKS